MSHYPQAEFITSADRPQQFVADDGAEVAFAGRSNAGKSSAINALVNRRQFAKVSKTPGRTRLVNFFRIGSERRLVDLPGYGFARVANSERNHWRDLMNDYFGTRRSLQGLFLIVDIRRGITGFDEQMLVLAENIDADVHVLLTKADKLKRGPAASALLQFRRELSDGATVQLFSATKKTGVSVARERLEQMLAGGPVTDAASGKKKPRQKAGE